CPAPPRMTVAPLAGRVSLRIDDERLAEHLAGRAAGKLVEDFDAARILVRREPLLDEGGELFRLDVSDHERGHLLAEAVVRYTDDRRFAHGGMGRERVFDLARVHRVAAAQDDVL